MENRLCLSYAGLYFRIPKGYGRSLPDGADGYHNNNINESTDAVQPMKMLKSREPH